jgi:hypothetical protein
MKRPLQMQINRFLTASLLRAPDTSGVQQKMPTPHAVKRNLSGVNLLDQWLRWRGEYQSLRLPEHTWIHWAAFGRFFFGGG